MSRRRIFARFLAYIVTILKLQKVRYYKLKDLQTLAEVAEAFCVSERALVRENGLTEPPKQGQILKIPLQSGNVYTARAGDDKTLLSGSEEAYALKNGESLYLGKRVIL